MANGTGPVVTFEPDGVMDDLTARTSELCLSLGDVARRDLERYYTILRHELRAADLTKGEAAALCDVLVSTWMDAHTARLLDMEVEDALADGLDDKWGIDGLQLARRLAAMPWSRRMAIADAVERWWALQEESRTLSEGLATVGLQPMADGPRPADK